jgi:hypothetical protein
LSLDLFQPDPSLVKGSLIALRAMVLEVVNAIQFLDALDLSPQIGNSDSNRYVHRGQDS